MPLLFSRQQHVFHQMMGHWRCKYSCCLGKQNSRTMKVAVNCLSIYDECSTNNITLQPQPELKIGTTAATTVRAWHGSCMKQRTGLLSAVTRRWVTRDGIGQFWEGVEQSAVGQIYKFCRYCRGISFV